MHLQIRTSMHASPPDLELFLRRLADDGINLVAVGGSNVEFGGEFAFVPEDEQVDAAKATLDRFGYTYRVVFVDDDNGLDLCEVDDQPGAFHACMVGIAQKNLNRGRIVRDVLIGVATADTAAGKIPIHVFSEEIRTPASMTPQNVPS